MNVFEEKIRRDYEPMRESGSRVGFEKGRIGRVKVDPSELAAYNLYKVLEKYPEFTKESRSQIQNKYKNLEGLETMNLEVLSSVLTFLKNYPEPTPESFKDEIILEYFSRLLPTKEILPSEKKRFIIRLKSQFLKYIRFINNFEKEIEEEQTQAGEIEDEDEEEVYEEEYQDEDDSE